MLFLMSTDGLFWGIKKKKVSLWIKIAYNMNKKGRLSQWIILALQVGTPNYVLMSRESCYIAPKAELKWFGMGKAQTTTAAMTHFSLLYIVK